MKLDPFETYCLYNLDDASFQLSVPCQEVHDLELKNDPDYVIPQRRHKYNPEPSSSSCSESEDEDVTAKNDLKNTKLKQYDCSFCRDSFSSGDSLRKHFKTGHKIKENKIVNILQKVHLQRINKGKRKFLCLECLEIVDEKFRHKLSVKKGSKPKFGNHEPRWLTVQTLADLPQFILDQAEKTETELNDKYLKSKTYKELLEEYKKLRLRDIEMNKSSSFTSKNLNGKLSKLRSACIITKGLTDASKIEEWIYTYDKVLAPKSIMNILRDLKNFIDQFLIPKYGTQNTKVDFTRFVKMMDTLISKEYRANRGRQQLSRRAYEQSLPEPSEIKELSKRTLSWLQETLTPQTDSLDQETFRKKLLNLMTLMLLRNATRLGTISLFRTEYLNYSHYSQSLGMFCLELAPEGLQGIHKGPGERKRLAEMEKLLMKTHKNFYCEGIKWQAVSELEMELLRLFANLRQKMSCQNHYLFAPMHADTLFSSEDQKCFVKNWYRSILRQHGMQHLDLTTTAYRKLMATNWKETVPDPKTLEALTQLTGHTAETARRFYELERTKMQNAAITSVYTDRVLDERANQVACFSQGPAIGEVAEEDFEETPFETTNQLEKDDDAEIHSENGEVDEEFISSEDVTNEEVEIISFLKTRKPRPNMASYVLSKEDYKTVAALYRIHREKQPNFSAKFRHLNLPMNLDAIKSLFRQIKKHLED